MVRTGEKGSKGISCLMVDGNTPNMSLGRKEKKVTQYNTMYYVKVHV